MIEKLDELVTWFYDECEFSEVSSIEDIFSIYKTLLRHIHNCDIIIECDEYDITDIEDPVDSAEIGEEYRCFIEIPVLNADFNIILSYLKIEGKYSADLEYAERESIHDESYFDSEDDD